MDRMLVIFLLVPARSFSGVRFWCWVVCICSDSCCTDERRFWWWISLWYGKCDSVVTTWRVSADRMDQSLPEVIADRISTGPEKTKARRFLYEPSGIWWPSQTWTADQSIMSEGLSQYHCTINIVTLPRITPKSTSKITSPDYPHDFTDVADGSCWQWLVRRRRSLN